MNPRTSHHSVDLLELRCQMAVARAIAPNDSHGAEVIANRVFLQVAIAAFQDQTQPEEAPWSIKSDPALLFAYEQNIVLRRQYAEIAAEFNAALGKVCEKEESERAERAKANQEWVDSQPSAESMLADLQADKTLDLNGHSLGFEREFGGLTGTNSYGTDYFAGQMTLATVSHWREAMLAGEIWGAHNESSCHEVEEGYADPKIASLKDALHNIEDKHVALGNRFQ